MKWTKAHSKNAVAAKQRLRIARENAPVADEPKWKEPKLGRFVPDFTINIRTRTGERLQITATRFGKQFLTGDGIRSARSIASGIEHILTKIHL